MRRDRGLSVLNFVRNVTICFTLKKIRKIGSFFLLAETAIFNRLQTIIVYMWIRLLTRWMNWRRSSATSFMTQPYHELKTTPVQSVAIGKPSFSRLNRVAPRTRCVCTMFVVISPARTGGLSNSFFTTQIASARQSSSSRFNAHTVKILEVELFHRCPLRSLRADLIWSRKLYINIKSTEALQIRCIIILLLLHASRNSCNIVIFILFW